MRSQSLMSAQRVATEPQPHEPSPGGWIPVSIELIQRLISMC